MKPFSKSSDIFPGGIAFNVLLIILGSVISLFAFTREAGKLVGYCEAFGSALFVAGFVGFLNVRLLSKEVNRIVEEPFENISFIHTIRGAGIENIYRNRVRSIEEMIKSMDIEEQEIIIVGCSLKGLIGVGFDAIGEQSKFREGIVHALKKNIGINILLTDPRYACFRAVQEARNVGDIEAEIIENLLYFIRLRYQNPRKASNLKIKLFHGTPTIFLLATSKLMVINPYPYFSTAFGSFSFELWGGSEMYKAYYYSHYSRAWTTPGTTTDISNEFTSACVQIKALIEEVNQHNLPVIPDKEKKQRLLNMLKEIEK